MKTLANNFRRALVSAVACVIVIATVGAGATAQTSPTNRTALEQRVLSFLEDLNLTDAQKIQIQAILGEERTAFEVLLRQLIATQDELRAALRERQFDETRVRAIATRLAPTVAELIVARERTFSKIYNVLTPEQRALLERKRAELSARFNVLASLGTAVSADSTLFESIAARLNLNPAQRLAVMFILAVEYPGIDALVKSLIGAQEQMRAATENGRFDEAQVRAIATRQAQAVAQLTVTLGRVLSKLYAVLTPEQRAVIESSLDAAAARLRGLLDFVSIDDTRFFVRQHYVDFLSREPERAGFESWVAVLERCGGDAQCLARTRTEVSSAFFRSQEFQAKGYYVYRFYRATLGRLPKFAEIMPDMRAVTGQTAEEVHLKRDAFASAWMERAEFRARYEGLSNAAFVDKLLSTAGALASRRGEFVTAIETGQKTRAGVLKEVVESEEFFAREYNGAFVAMQYFGYLRRDPEAEGYNAWLNYLNQHPADYQTMVWGFVASTEYRARFGN